MLNVNFPEAFSQDFEEMQNVLRGVEIYQSFGLDEEIAFEFAQSDQIEADIPVEELLEYFS